VSDVPIDDRADAAPARPAPDALTIARDGLWSNNPALVQLLGLCPLLAVTGTVVNALSLGLATILVLVGSNGEDYSIRKEGVLTFVSFDDDVQSVSDVDVVHGGPPGRGRCSSERPRITEDRARSAAISWRGRAPSRRAAR